MHEREIPEHERADETSSDKRSESHNFSWGLIAILLFFIVVGSLQIFETPVISPTWLQYVVLIAVPLLGGYLTIRWMSKSNSAKN